MRFACTLAASLVLMASATQLNGSKLTQDEKITLKYLFDWLDKDQDGLSLIKDIKAQVGKHIPSAIVTALQDQELKETCLSQGIQFLNKPLKPAKLRALLQSLAKQKSTS